MKINKLFITPDWHFYEIIFDNIHKKIYIYPLMTHPRLRRIIFANDNEFIEFGISKNNYASFTDNQILKHMVNKKIVSQEEYLQILLLTNE